MASVQRFENVNVSVVQSRWDVVLTIEHGNDEPDTVLIASADSSYTEGDGIWFGTLAEYDEESRRRGVTRAAAATSTPTPPAG